VTVYVDDRRQPSLAGRALDGRVRGLFQRGYAYWRTVESMRGRNESIASAPWNAIAAR
jgi:hypothetical protein